MLYCAQAEPRLERSYEFVTVNIHRKRLMNTGLKHFRQKWGNGNGSEITRKAGFWNFRERTDISFTPQGRKYPRKQGKVINIGNGRK